MKDFANVYSYERKYEYDENTKKITHSDGDLYAVRNNRGYKTKMNTYDLPEHYCDVQRYMDYHNVINTKDIKSLHYTWVKENHFMKDSILRVSYTGDIESKKLVFHNGEKFIISPVFTDYTNVDEMVFGNDILKFLSYVRKFSNYDITHIKQEFVSHCNWLKENEPCFAPECDDFEKWFDENTNIK